jgi:hypothetical protein
VWYCVGYQASFLFQLGQRFVLVLWFCLFHCLFQLFFICLTVAFLGSPLYLLLSPCWPIWSYGSLFQSIRYAMTTQTFKTQVIWWFLLLYERRPQWCSYQSGYRWHSLSLSANKYYQLLRSLVSLTIICFFLQTFWLIVYSVISVRTCLFLYSNMKSKLHAWNTILITWIGSSKAEHWHDLLFSSQWSLWADNQVFSKRDMDILFKKRGWVNLEFFFFVIWNCFINDRQYAQKKPFKSIK